MEVGSATSSAPAQVQVAMQKKEAKQEEKVIGTLLSSIDPGKGGKLNVLA